MIMRRVSVVLAGLLFLSSCSSGGGEALRVRNAAVTCYDTQADKDRAADEKSALLEAPRAYLKQQASQYNVPVEGLAANVADSYGLWVQLRHGQTKNVAMLREKLEEAERELQAGSVDKQATEAKISALQSLVDSEVGKVERSSSILQEIEALLARIDASQVDEQRILKELSWIRDMPLCVAIEPIDDSATSNTEVAATETSVTAADGDTEETDGEKNEQTDRSESTPSEITKGKFGDCRDDMPGMFEYVLKIGEDVIFTFGCEVVGVTTYRDSAFEANYLRGGIVVRGVRVGTSQIVVATKLPSGAIFNWSTSIEVVSVVSGDLVGGVLVGTEQSSERGAADESSSTSTGDSLGVARSADSCQLLSLEGPDRVELFSTFDVVVRHTPCTAGEDPVHVLFTGLFGKFEVIRGTDSFTVRVTTSTVGYVTVLVNYPKEGRRQGFFEAKDVLVQESAADEDPCAGVEPILRYSPADGGTLTLDQQCRDAVGVLAEITRGGEHIVREGINSDRLPLESLDVDAFIKKYGAVTLTLEHICRVGGDSFVGCGNKASLSLAHPDAVKPPATDSSATSETVVVRPSTDAIAAPPSADDSPTTTVPSRTDNATASTTTTVPEQSATQPMPVQWLSPTDSAESEPVFEPASISVDPGTVLLTCEDDCVAEIAERTGAEPDSIEVQVDGGDWQPALGALIPIGVGTTNVRFKGTPQSGAPVELEANFYDSTTPIVPFVAVDGSGEVTDESGAVVGTVAVYETMQEESSAILRWIVPLLALLALLFVILLLINRQRAKPSTTDGSDRTTKA